MTRSTYLTMSADGEVVVPNEMRQDLGLPNEGKLIARVEDGALILETVAAAVRRAQAIVRQYIPEGVSLVDELIAERRAEALREDNE